MPRFLITARYTSEGAKGLMTHGGTARQIAVEKAVTELGGRLESFDFAFGDNDVYTIVDLPDNKAAAAMALSVSASGRVHVTTTPLLTPAEIDAAAQEQVNYQSPGS